ncbi:iron complex transport system permease protein [Prauserella sediminis]|uniref:Iron complex transport system permease protein n=1 Tax=Prauserella sediminis TaxID=577680 RepID=A0A839XU29_9PSEU|nr:iron ABC transporter permease [Prauserella sediminis]MBB3664073.1 iron complex transport system permease protein [Prauserella sediminis]
MNKRSSPTERIRVAVGVSSAGERASTTADVAGIPSQRAASPRPQAPRPREGRAGWRSTVVWTVSAVALLAVACALSLVVGSYPSSPARVLSAVLSPGQADVDTIVWHVRIPRTVSGLLAGSALGVAGAVMQGLTRNPLAGPGILGVNAGASLAVVTAIALGVTTAGGHLWFAFAGAGAAALFVYVLGSLGRGGATPVKLALAGAALTAMVGSMTTIVTLLDAATLDEYRFWAVGSLTRAGAEVTAAVGPFLVTGFLLALTVSGSLNTIALGEDMARSLGTRLVAIRVLAAVSVLLLAGTATVIAGPIAFVGLAVPHIARLLIGPDYRWIMPLSALLGPILLLLADVAGRWLVQPEQLQVGIVTGLAGGPLFLYLVRRRKVAQL